MEQQLSKQQTIIIKKQNSEIENMLNIIILKRRLLNRKLKNNQKNTKTKEQLDTMKKPKPISENIKIQKEISEEWRQKVF